MALSVNEMRSISVAFYESLPPSVEEIVESILMAAQAAAKQGKWHTTYKGSGFVFARKHGLNVTQRDIMDRLASLGYSPRVEDPDDGLTISW